MGRGSKAERQKQSNRRAEQGDEGGTGGWCWVGLWQVGHTSLSNWRSLKELNYDLLGLSLSPSSFRTQGPNAAVTPLNLYSYPPTQY